jgi:uncharacterized protein YhaN
MPPAKKATGTRAPGKAGRKRGPAKMTAEHKQALAEGREASRHVRAYLEALDANKPKRGRKRTRETVQRQLDEVKDQIGPATGLRKLELAQRRIDLEAELEAFSVKVDLSELRKGFVKHAKPYAKRKGISYSAWREAGVPAEDLKAAGITRGAV